MHKKQTLVSDLPGYAKILAEMGSHTAAAVIDLYDLIQGSSLLTAEVRESVFPVLSDALKGWIDDQAAEVVRAIHDGLQRGNSPDLPSLSRWIRVHRGDARAVVDCLTTDPPQGITILQLLSRAGSQKLVFLATWQVPQREVVLKRFIVRESADRLLERELQPHPLSMEHPNIIETHMLQNREGERFLVEHRLPVVLNDQWESKGVAEAANLLRDIASALSFLVDKERIHGDIKPDNIGYEDGRYILLDFGICRPEGSFAEETPTGSLRTRAPELLAQGAKHSYASDVWALGATVYNTVVGRFPLFGKGESAPRISKPEDRALFEAKLAQRVDKEWDARVKFDVVHQPLRPILQRMLARSPADRPHTSEIVKWCENELAAVLRKSEGQNRFSPAEELSQLFQHLPSKDVLALMPTSRKHRLRDRLRTLREYKGLSTNEQEQIQDLEDRLTAPHG